MEGTVNGQRYAYVHIKVTFPFGLVNLLESIEYDDEDGGEVVTDMSGMPAGYVPGEYSGTCKAEMAFSEAHRFEEAAAASGGFYNMPPTPVTVTYGHPAAGQLLITDVLEVKWIKRSKPNSKGDKMIKRSFEGVLTRPIVSNGKPALTRT